VALLTQRPTRWLGPFVTLAWEDGQTAMHRRLATPANRPSAHRHRLRLGGPCVDGLHTRLAFCWTVTNATTPFHRLRGDFEVRELASSSVLGLIATVESHVEGDEASAVRLSELVVRLLLGHLRTAVEALTSQPGGPAATSATSLCEPTASQSSSTPTIERFQ
jgi:hypothetical protein